VLVAVFKGASVSTAQASRTSVKEHHGNARQTSVRLELTGFDSRRGEVQGGARSQRLQHRGFVFWPIEAPFVLVEYQTSIIHTRTIRKAH
jgi:hypothetical protein